MKNIHPSSYFNLGQPYSRKNPIKDQNKKTASAVFYFDL